MSLTRDRIATDEEIINNKRCDDRLTHYCEIPSLEESKKLYDKFIRGNLPCYKYPSDAINHPPHYTSSEAKCSCGKKIECIDVTRHLSFNIGNAIKSLWRVDPKGASVDDLRKAAWYIQDEIAKRVKI